MAIRNRKDIVMVNVCSGGAGSTISSVNTINSTTKKTPNLISSTSPGNVSPTTNKIIQTTDNGMNVRLQSSYPKASGMKTFVDYGSNTISYAYDLGNSLVTTPIVPSVVYHTVTFTIPAGFPDSGEVSVRVENGSKILPKLFPTVKDTADYTFSRWEEKTLKVSPQKLNYIVGQDLHFVAKYDAIKRITVRIYLVNEGSQPGIAIEDMKWEVHDEYRLRVGYDNLLFLKNMTASMAGFDFKGWYFTTSILSVENIEIPANVEPMTNAEMVKKIDGKSNVINIFPIFVKRNVAYSDTEILEFIDAEKQKARANAPKNIAETFNEEATLKRTFSYYPTDYDITRELIDIAAPSDTTINVTNLATINSIDNNSILSTIKTDYVVEHFNLSDYYKRDNNKYYTTKIIEDGQHLGTYYIEEYEYYLEKDGAVDNSTLEDNIEISRKGIKNKFIADKKIFQEGYYKYRGDLIPSGNFKKKEDDIFREMSLEFLNNNNTSFYNANLLYGSDAYHKMSVFANGLNKLITTSASILEEHKRISSNIREISDLVSITLIEQKFFNTNSFSFIAHGGESVETKLSKDRNTFQRLIDYKNFPTKKSYDDMLNLENEISSIIERKNDSETGDNILNYYYVDGKVVFGFDSRPNFKYKIFMEDLVQPIASLLSSYMIDGTVQNQKKDVFIKDWNDNYSGKMDVMIDRIYEEPDHMDITKKLKYSTFINDTVVNSNYKVFNDINIIGANSPFLKLVKKENNTANPSIWGVL